MNMNLSSPSSPATIVSGKKALSIPIYQRLFVWGANQIDTLLRDLWISCTHPDKTDEENPKSRDYHLGVITAHENEAQQWEIVDGQQRLTFLTLLGCMFERKIHQDIGDWRSFVWLEPLKELRLFFHGRSPDTEDIEKYLLRERQTFQNPAFARFAERFDLFAHGKTQEELKEFAAYCFEHAVFLVNELPKNYGSKELNLYFEKMNSTGRQLSPLEVVKGKWFSPYAHRWNACMNFDNPLSGKPSDNNDLAGKKEDRLLLTDVIKQSEKFRTFFGKISPKDDGTQKSYKRLVMKPEILALHVLCILQKNGELAFDGEIPLDSRKLIETFGKVVSFEKGDFNAKAKKFIERLEAYRQWIDQNIVYLDDDDGKTVYTFRSDKLENDDDQERDSSMRQLQAMLYVSSGEAQEWVLEAYKKNPSGGVSLQDLEKQDNQRKELPKENGCLDVEAFTYQSHNRYWFFKLDYLLWKYRDKWIPKNSEWRSAIQNFSFRPNRSIEHLHPQNPQVETWAEEDVKTTRDSFGNLALISSSSNSFLSNLPLNEKFARVQRLLNQGYGLESLKMALMGMAAGFDESHWTADRARKHETAMLDLLQAEYNGTIDAFIWEQLKIWEA